MKSFALKFPITIAFCYSGTYARPKNSFFLSRDEVVYSRLLSQISSITFVMEFYGAWN